MLADIELTRAEPGCLQFHIKTTYVQKFVVDSSEYIEGDMKVKWLVMKSEYELGKR